MDVATGIWYEPGQDEDCATIWDVTAVRLPDGRAVFVGAGHDWKVYRWDTATGHAMGNTVRASDQRQGGDVDDRCRRHTPVIISGCEAGQIRRWNAVTGEPIGGPLDGSIQNVIQLAMLRTMDRDILVGLDMVPGELHRWDAQTGTPIGATITIPPWSVLIDVYTDPRGVPTTLVDVGDAGGAPEGVHRWRLGSGTPIDGRLPDTVRAVYYDGTRTVMALLGPGPTLTTAPV